MKYQIYVRGIVARITYPPPSTNDPCIVEQTIKAVIKKAIHDVGKFPIELAGEPMYAGANTWLVPFTDAPILSPVEAGSEQEAIAKAEQITGYMGDDLRAEIIGEA